MFNAEDPYFEDFTNWLRNDEPGQPVQVSWRPTRRRLATLDWAVSTESARLNFREEEAFVPNFVKVRAAKGRRRKPFPSDEAEFHVATVDAFAGDGHSVLVYCPVRTQTESLAKAFLKASKQDYLEHVRPLAPADFEFAAAIGREWLGVSHSAYSALEAGIGIHHGALPRPFLSAIEHLLHQRKLSVVIASPTLAQGLDLSCSVLVFRSLRRYEQGQWKCIPAAEFSNVLGRVGRAFVDLDGIAVMPTFDASKRNRDHKDYSDLIEASTGQHLVSGLARLVYSLVHRVSFLLGVQPQSFSEYVLNHPNVWDDPKLTDEDDENEEDETDAATRRLSADLADLDVAILSTIDQLGADVTQVATLLDETLKGSLWRRTLNREDALWQTVERGVLISRATWLWNRTSAQQRAAFYASGLGTEPGSFLDSHREDLIDSLAQLHAGFLAGDAPAAGLAAVRFATIVLGHPFFGVRTLPEEWDVALQEWIAGVPSAEILEGRTGHDFNRMQILLQDAIAFKLVWAAEADQCLDATCYHSKVEAFLDREIAAHPGLVQIENGWRNPKEQRPGAVQRGHVREIEAMTDNPDAEPVMPCAAAKTAIVVYGKQLGRKLTVCTDKDCPVHDPQAAAEAAAHPVPTMAPTPDIETEEEAAERQAEFERQRAEYEEERQRREQERQQQFEREQAESEAESNRRAELLKTRQDTFERILENAPAMFTAAQLRVFLRALCNLDPYAITDDVAEHFAGDNENNQQTAEEILSSALSAVPDEKLRSVCAGLIS